MASSKFAEIIKGHFDHERFNACLSTIKQAVENGEVPDILIWKESFAVVKSRYSDKYYSTADKHVQQTHAVNYKRFCKEQIELCNKLIGEFDEQTTVNAVTFKTSIESSMNDLSPKDDQLTDLRRNEPKLREAFESVQNSQPAHNRAKINAMNALCYNLFDQYKLTQDERLRYESILIMAQVLLEAQKSVADATFVEGKPPTEADDVGDMLEQVNAFHKQKDDDEDMTDGLSVEKIIRMYTNKLNK